MGYNLISVLKDISTKITTMNGNIANLGSNHIIGINEAPAGATGYFVRYGNGTGTPLANEAEKTSYTDTNNIGATNVQRAIDKLANTSTWKYLGAVTGTNHMNYPASWQELWIQVVGQDTTWQNYDFTILKEFINNPNRPNASAFRNGFYVSSSDYGEATIVVSATDVNINSVRVNGNNQTANAIMRVYYK